MLFLSHTPRHDTTRHDTTRHREAPRDLRLTLMLCPSSLAQPGLLSACITCGQGSTMYYGKSLGNRSRTLNLTNRRLLHSGWQRAGISAMPFRTCCGERRVRWSLPHLLSGSSPTMRVKSQERTPTTKGPTSQIALGSNVDQSEKVCQEHLAYPCCGASLFRAHQPSASLCGETSSDSSHQSLRMLLLLLPAALVQGSDGTLRITVLVSARQPQPGPLVIEPG